MSGFPACIQLYHMCAMPMKAGIGLGPPETGVTHIVSWCVGTQN